MIHYTQSIDDNVERLMSDDTSYLTSLITRIAHADERALEELYHCTVNRVYGLAKKFVSKADLAEEVVGDVYMQVWEQADRYSADKAVPIAWLLMICRSRALDKLRREKRFIEQTVADEQSDWVEPVDTGEPILEMMNDELSTEMNDALALLSVTQRQTLCLAFYKGMSHQEISSYTGDPLGTVKSNLRRAQVVLRNALLGDCDNNGGLYGNG